MRERVHLSEQTALQLIKHGKEDWIVKRDDMVEAKGKGKLVTFWLKLTGHESDVVSNFAGSEVDGERTLGQKRQSFASKEWSVEMPTSKPDEVNQRNDRLVQWNSEILLELLQRVVARRIASQSSRCVSPDKLTSLARSIGDGSTVVEEVVEVIDMPDFVCTNGSGNVELSEVVVMQLRAFVAKIASMYNDNPFHNFEHASHVTMSINKLLCRIVAPQMDPNVGSDADRQAAFLHDHTCGITSDPLTQFAVVLSGLIHDLDHPGVSNGQLIKEDPKLAMRYKEKSVAEQNSVDLAWSILMTSGYDELRAAIFSTEAELRRFRSLLVNSIIATDIFDKDQGTLRKNRWNKAFFETTPDDSSHEVKSRKATIVIEHLIQASDVAHTMQHWHVYQKWNQRLFNEMMMAFKDGRADKDPSEGWYGGELWFFLTIT
jgi:3'5'-cyclic nucleotide phosphodiesterase